MHEEIYIRRNFFNVELIVLVHINSIVLIFTLPLQKKKHINDHVNVWIIQACPSKEVEDN
jgi:competence protein ComGC